MKAELSPHEAVVNRGQGGFGRAIHQQFGHLIGKFIWILINWKVFRCVDVFIRHNSSDYACSMWKFFKQARKCGNALRMAVIGKLQFADWCKIFLFNIKSLLIEPKKGKRAGFTIVNDIFNP